MNLSKLFTVSWSARQRAFHTETLDDALGENLKDYYEESDSDWKILAVVQTHEEACQFRRQLEQTLDRPSG